MTLKDILEIGYGIDFSTLRFEVQKNADTCTKEEIMNSLSNDELIVNGEMITAFDIYGDTPNGYVELYYD